MNVRFIVSIMGFVLVFLSAFMMICGCVALLYNEGDFFSLAISSVITFLFGFTSWFFFRVKSREMIKREGYVVVTLVWVLVSVFGALPFYIGSYIPSYTDAFFETMSGFTTTGASILNDIEALPHGILFWRSMTHFIGGMGIIVLAVAILPYFGFGGMQLYSAETSGISSEKLHPHITKTAKTFWGIYVALVALQVVFLLLGKMPLFDALCHSFGTLATGGFSPKNTSIINYSPYIQYVIVVFMFLGGTNFTLHYFALKGRWEKIRMNTELRTYFMVVLISSLFIALFLVIIHHREWEPAFRSALFQVTSIVTTTGFISDDYMLWSPFLVVLIFLLMFSGASAGSTCGGIKIMRHNILFRNTTLEFKRMVHPQAVIPLRIGGKVIPKEVVLTVLAFVMLYLLIFTVSSFSLTMMGVPWASSMGACATTMAGIGPGLGKIGGAVGNFSQVPVAGKWLMSFLMLVGRLELFTVLILFSPEFWRNN
jgi:trk system potassium uptake protein TrkH